MDSESNVVSLLARRWPSAGLRIISFALASGIKFTFPQAVFDDTVMLVLLDNIFLHVNNNNIIYYYEEHDTSPALRLPLPLSHLHQYSTAMMTTTVIPRHTTEMATPITVLPTSLKPLQWEDSISTSIISQTPLSSSSSEMKL